MKAVVTPQGIVIPHEMLQGATEVEIRQENNRIVIIPMHVPDPILRLGSAPIDDTITDASLNHDQYLYP